MWPERPAARRERRAAEGVSTTYPLADFPNRLLDDDDDVDPLDPGVDHDLDLEAIAAWEHDPGGQRDADHEQTASRRTPAPEQLSSASERPPCRRCRKVCHRYAQTADGGFAWAAPAGYPWLG